MLRLAIAFLLMALGAAAATLSMQNDQANDLASYFLVFVLLGVLSFGMAMLERSDQTGAKPRERGAAVHSVDAPRFPPP